jgi:hypothetical protein
MPPFGVTILATVSQKSEIPEGLANYPVDPQLVNESPETWKIFDQLRPAQTLALS